MADSRTFAPEELDRIEDALEDLEGATALDEYEPNVREALRDYQNILALSREALDPVDVPAGALDAVFEEARQSPAITDADSSAVAVAATPSRRRWWSLWIPGLTAAAAAVLVFAVQPDKEQVTASAERQAQAPAQTAAPARVEPAEGSIDAPEGQAEAVLNLAEDRAAPSPPASASTPARRDSEDKRPLEATRSKEDSRGRQPSKKKSAPRSPAKPSASKTADADPVKGAALPRDEQASGVVAQGDRARRRGNCTLATSHYRRALQSSDPQVRARAEAGLGLCADQSGNSKSAIDHIGRARQLDPNIGSFIEAERKRQPDARTQAEPNAASMPAEQRDE